MDAVYFSCITLAALGVVAALLLLARGRVGRSRPPAAVDDSTAVARRARQQAVKERLRLHNPERENGEGA
jgi:hypothetical protein